MSYEVLFFPLAGKREIESVGGLMAKLYGYAGKLLRVDLTNEKVTEVPLLPGDGLGRDYW